jgi:hypothetical protein
MATTKKKVEDSPSESETVKNVTPEQTNGPALVAKPDDVSYRAFTLLPASDTDLVLHWSVVGASGALFEEIDLALTMCRIVSIRRSRA